MDEVKRKIYLDLFAAPVTLLPIAGGLTALLASWALGGQALLTFGGMAGVLTGLGTFATRLIFGLEELVDRAYQYSLQKQQVLKDRELQELQSALEQDQDPRTRALLQQLTRTYRRLEADTRAGRIKSAAQGAVQSVEQMFRVCVEYLRRSYELWEEAQRRDGPGRKRLLQQRAELVTEVEGAAEFLESKLEQLQSTNSRKGRSELDRLRAELDESIRIARQAEERVEAIGRREDSAVESE